MHNYFSLSQVFLILLFSCSLNAEAAIHGHIQGAPTCSSFLPLLPFFESLQLCAFLIRITNIRLSDSRDQFTLMCLVCGKGLEGEKQAVEVPLLAVPFVSFSSRCDVSD
jgi:hypothetical protein